MGEKLLLNDEELEKAAGGVHLENLINFEAGEKFSACFNGLTVRITILYPIDTTGLLRDYYARIEKFLDNKIVDTAEGKISNKQLTVLYIEHKIADIEVKEYE